MNTSGFDYLFMRCGELQKRKVAVVCPYEDDALIAINEAREAGYISAALVGETARIRQAADKLGISLGNFEIIEGEGEENSAEAAVRAVSSGRADLLMKGLIKTSTLLKAVLNKEWGLRGGRGSLLSHVMFAEVPAAESRIFAITDGGMNMYPDARAKAEIINNAVSCLHKLGVMCPDVAVLSAAKDMSLSVPVYGVNAKAPIEEQFLKSAEDAAILCKMNERGIIKGCKVYGPVGLETALRGIAASVLLVPDIETGNMLGKSMSYIAGSTCAGVLLGAAKPVIMLSRHDTARTKLCSIALGAVVSG